MLFTPVLHLFCLNELGQIQLKLKAARFGDLETNLLNCISRLCYRTRQLRKIRISFVKLVLFLCLV